jgi:iron complex outermembrane receptor protein
LYGNSEPGGTLNIVTKKPEFKSKHAVDASIGSYDFYRVTIDSTAALSSNFAYRLNVAQEDKGSFRDYIDSSRTLIAPAFTWLINNKTTLSYDGEFLRQKAPLDRGLVSIDGDTAAVPIENFLGNPADGDITLNSQNHQLSLTHEITDEWDAHIGVAHKRGSLEGLASEVRPFTIVTGDSVNLRTRYRDYQTTDTTLQADVHGKLKEHDLLIGTEIYQFTNDQILNNRNKRKALITAKMLVPLMKKDKYIGKVGTKDRDEYEYELRMDILSRMIKTARQERNLTQEQLGSLIGVQKSQISKLESSSNSASIDTLLKVFKALKAEIHFNVKMEEDYLELV